MFPFLAFAPAGQAQSAPESSRAAVNFFTAPWTAAALPKPAPARPLDAGDVFVDFLRTAISFWAQHFETLGNRASLLFAQIAAALAFERLSRETSAAVTQAYAVFGLKPPQAAIPQAWPQFQQFAPLIAFIPGAASALNAFGPATASALAPAASALAPWAAFNPWLNPALAQTPLNPWAAIAESVNVWTKVWQPAAPQNLPAPRAENSAKPFTATVTAPGGFTWGFTFGN